MNHEYIPDKFKKDKGLTVTYSGYVPGQEHTRKQPGYLSHIDIDDFIVNGSPVKFSVHTVLMESIGEEIRDEILQKIKDGEIYCEDLWKS